MALMTKNWEKFTSEKKLYIFLVKKVQFEFSYPQASIKDVQVTEEAFCHQKRTSSTSKHEISKKVLFLWVIFALLGPVPDLDSGSGYGSTDLIESGSNPDPKHWYF
jgi:hypothetical protein